MHACLFTFLKMTHKSRLCLYLINDTPHVAKIVPNSCFSSASSGNRAFTNLYWYGREWLNLQVATCTCMFEWFKRTLVIKLFLISNFTFCVNFPDLSPLSVPSSDVWSWHTFLGPPSYNQNFGTSLFLVEVWWMHSCLANLNSVQHHHQNFNLKM